MQYDIFEPPAQRHSETSKQAAEQIKQKAPILRDFVLRAIQRRPDTDEELAVRTGMEGNTLRPRRRELELMGLIRKSGEVRKTKSGRNAVVWEAVS